jgi:hypothetical protein
VAKTESVGRVALTVSHYVALTVSHYTVSIQQRRAWTADSCFPGGDARITLRAIPGPSGMTRPQLARFRAKIWRPLRAA